MKKLLLVTLLSMFFIPTIQGQVFMGQVDLNKVPVRGSHYEPELTFDNSINKEAWKNQQGMHVAMASTDKLYFRTEVPDLKSEADDFTETVWRGERLNKQLLVWSADTLNQVRFIVHDLKSDKGDILSKKNISLQMVRYVLSNYPYGAKNVACDGTPYKDGYLMPDRFESFDRFDLPGQTTRPVWLTVDVPSETVPGIYTGTIEAKSKNYTVLLPIKIKVQNHVLPSPHDWKYQLDLWQNPWAVAWNNHLVPWSEEHKVLLKKHLKLYADAGGKFITTYAVHSPWSDNSYMIEGGMIEWIKEKNGAWKFDYKIFDEYVQLAMDCGIDKAITIYTPIPWGNRVRYLDETTGNYNYSFWVPGTEDYKTQWSVFLTDLKNHLQQKGWLNITYIGINENEMSQTLAAIKVVKDHSKEWRITYAGDWHPELDSLLNDYCFVYGKEPSLQQLEARKARGFTSTYYVCCTPPVPNNFVFSPPIQGRWISWYASAFGYDGFLRWAYDAWPEDPMRDARHGSWAAGDCYMIYPGSNSCIRFEKLREGIVDFEKIRIIREKAAKSTDKNVKKLISQLNNHLKVFTTERAFEDAKVTNDVIMGRKMVAELSERIPN